MAEGPHAPSQHVPAGGARGSKVAHELVLFDHLEMQVWVDIFDRLCLCVLAALFSESLADSNRKRDTCRGGLERLLVNLVLNAFKSEKLWVFLCGIDICKTVS